MNDATNRLALTTRFFGDDAQRLGVLFQNGNKGLKEFADQAHSLGLVLSEEMANNAAAANDQLTIMGKVVGIQATSVLVSLAPIITQVGQAFADAAPKVAAFFGQFGEVEGMTRGAATEAMQDASREYDRLAEKLQRRQLIDKDPSQSRQFSDLLLPSEEDIQERLAHYKKVFESTISRLRELNKGPEVNVLDEAAKKATEAFNEMGAAASKASPETKKLFDTKAGNPLDGMASDAAKISKTFNLIGNALTIDGKGGDAKQSIEDAAAAINKLAKEGTVAEQTIKDMTASLNEARTGKESPELKLIATIEDTQAKA
ncbi:MAG: hypothetical protein GY927_04255, partial [bacterium]|nr:hypothetical protein [bacterium]